MAISVEEKSKFIARRAPVSCARPWPLWRMCSTTIAITASRPKIAHAEPPAAGDVRPVVRAQVDAGQPDRRGQHHRAVTSAALASRSRRVNISAAATQAVA